MIDDTTPSDKDVLDATGRHPDEWFAFLDAQGATQWSREGIGEWLSGALVIVGLLGDRTIEDVLVFNSEVAELPEEFARLPITDIVVRKG